jgi:ribosomal protein S18 acetylase RimI-like enzyme
VEIAVKTAILQDASDIAKIARDTFVLACPSSADPGKIEKYISYNLNTEYFENVISSKAAYIACAFVDGEMAGFVVAIYNSSCESLANFNNAAEIQKLYIRPKFHGKEIAYKLMTSAITEITKPGIDTIWLGVYSNNIKAKKFYSKFGFNVVGKTNFTMGSEIHLDHIMAVSTT